MAPFFGYAQRSPTGRFWGQTPDVGHRILGVHLSTTILRNERFALTYAPNVVPALLLTNVPSRVGETCRTEQPGRPPVCEIGYLRRNWVYGSSVSPLGLGLRTATGTHSELLLGAAAGIGFFSRSTPVPGARKMNVVLEWGGSFTHDVTFASAFQIGYKFHHISNAYTRERNPGVDANLFYAGWRVKRVSSGTPAGNTNEPWQISTYTGFAARTSVGDQGAHSDGVNVFTAGMQFSTPLIRLGELSVDYNGSFAPLVMVTGMPKLGGICLEIVGGCSFQQYGTVTGMSVSPFGLGFRRANPGRLDLSLAGTIGGALFSRSLPVTESEKVKVVLEWGPRLDYRLTEFRSIQAGFRLYRLWSSYSTVMNRLIDANLF